MDTPLTKLRQKQPDKLEPLIAAYRTKLGRLRPASSLRVLWCWEWRE
jgi:hypothetical protein